MILLKNGTIIDGTGSRRYEADILIENDKIIEISKNGIEKECKTLDCSGKIIAPGFIDIHSHNDWFIGSEKDNYFIDPFIRQGITTFVGGNCGFGTAGFIENTEHKELLESNLFKEGLSNGIKWNSYSQYFDFLKKKGIKTNLAVLAGSGTIRTAIQGYSPEPLTCENLEKYLNQIELAMQQGARGLSFGMGYAPDIFSTFEEQVKAAEIVKKYNGFISVHVKAFSRVSGAYPLIPFGTPHNIKALKEFIKLARVTGVKLQLSHLIFVGKRTWPTADRALELIREAKAEGLDIGIDTYFHHSGATVITGILPEWFMAQVPQAYDNPKLLKKIKTLMNVSFKLLGFNYSDMRVAAANVEDLEQYNGLYLSEIAEKRGISNFENYIDIAKRSNSSARLLIDKYSSDEIITKLMKEPDCTFMTDAWMEPSGLQNPAVYSCFPGFIRKAIDKSVISIEQCIHKMTGANAKRAMLENRGIISEGNFADITIFAPYKVGDSAATDDKEKTGIQHVIINGKLIMEDGIIAENEKPGLIL
jgi:N-acyl-D-amino-acid deacylase